MSQEGANAELLAKAVDEIGQHFGESMRQVFALRVEQKKLSAQEFAKIETFMKLPPETRKMLLQNPQVRQQMLQAIDPESFKPFSGKVKKGSDLSGANKALDALGVPTAAENTAQAKADAESKQKQAEAAVVEHKMRLSTGVITPTATDLFTNFDFKDPLAAALAEGMMNNPEVKKQVTDLALFEKKGGPLYQKQQTQEWFGKMLDQGLPPGVAMTSAIAIAKGEWDKVPLQYTDLKTGKVIPVRGKAEQTLTFDAMNAASRAQEVQNTISSSIATLTNTIMTESGLPPDQARANAMALRNGKPVPYAMPEMRAVFDLNEKLKQQEVEKNTQTILNDKAGIGMIRESLNSMLQAYKQEGSYTWDSKQADTLKINIDKLQKSLADKLNQRYGTGLKLEDDPSWYQKAGRLIGEVWQSGVKTTGAFGLDLASDMFKGMDEVFKQTKQAALPGQTAPGGVPRVFAGKEYGQGEVAATNAEKAKLTAEQSALMSQMSDSFKTILNDPNVDSAQKESVQRFVREKFLPAYDDPSKFLELFNNPLAGSSAGGE